MIYRPYVERDFGPLYAIETICFQPPQRFSRPYMRHLVNDRNAMTWIAEEDGKMAGFAIADWMPGAENRVSYIQTIEVAPEWRGRKVGRELLRHIENSALEAGAQAIWLHVDAENRPAIGLYASNGFRAQGSRENYYGPGRTALIYRKELSDGGSSSRPEPGTTSPRATGSTG